MSRGSNVSRSSAQTAAIRPINEPENTRLQRDIFEYTIRLENEKRDLDLLDEQIKQSEDALGERNSLIKKNKPTDKEAQNSRIAISTNKH
jgi:hypothetical protein